MTNVEAGVIGKMTNVEILMTKEWWKMTNDEARMTKE
jgi:hypothetical protein